jgi:predicted TPR repeat methyltransferase
LGAEAAPSATPKSLVKNIFNDYARTFDEHLVNKLKYQTPIKLFQLIERSTPARDIDVLDLGCGTGLMGVHLRQIAKTLTGVDLSEKMLQEAKRRGIYDELHCSDISEVLGTHDRSYDLVVASDVFVYIGDLNPVFQLIKKSLKTNGLFCFSVEKSDADNFILRGTGRYAHSSKYIRDLAAALGFRVESIEAAVIRQESSRDVDGYISILRP